MGDWRTMGHAQRRRQGAPSVAAAAATSADAPKAPTFSGMLSQMQSGDRHSYRVGSHEFAVSYHARQSHGDDNRPVRGAFTGGYTVEYPGGRTSEHPHGPFATTEQAARRGASRDSKHWAASQASQAMISYASRNR